MMFQSSRVEIIAKQTESQERLASQLEEKIRKMERFGEEQNSLIMAVEKTAHDKVEEVEHELQEYVNNSQKDLRNISKAFTPSTLCVQYNKVRILVRRPSQIWL